MKPNNILNKAADTFIKKDAEYGSNWIQVGEILYSMFPNGLVLKTKDDFTRLQFIVWIAAKITRYSNNWKSGHEDSLHDLMVYTAMLQSFDCSNCLEQLNEFNIDTIAADEKNIAAPLCFGSNTSKEEKAIFDCHSCPVQKECEQDSKERL